MVGHHTGAGVAAQLTFDFPDEVAGLMLSGYPPYRDRRHRYSRLQLCREEPISPDGAELAQSWQAMNAMLGPDLAYSERREAFVDRLLGGELWYLPYVALFTTDTEALLERVRNPDRPTAPLAADKDSLSESSERAAAILGITLTSVEGTSWMPVGRPEVLVAAIRSWRPR